MFISLSANKRKMAQWTDEYAILRDLSVAQGRVPVAIERTVGAGDKPPSLNISEETEEEFYKHCSADGNVSAAPDFGLIQKMLDMVRDSNDWLDSENIDKDIVITKLNSHVPEFIPNQKNTSTPTNISPTKHIEKPKKRQRNIAVESILQAIADNKQSSEVILRKPDDFMNVGTKIEPTEKQVLKELKYSKDTSGVDNNTLTTPTATEKVNGWFETQTGSPFPKKTTKVTLEAANIVFKKKEKLKKFGKCPTETLKNSEKSPISSSSNSGEYKPSTLATEYYQKFVERSKFKESVKDNIWTKAEKKMKEIDDKRRREAQALTSPSSASQASRLTLSFEETQSTDTFTERIVAETKINRCLNSVALPQHRHQLTQNCVVCEAVMNKPKKIQIEIFEQNVDYGITNNTDNVDSTSQELENAYPEEKTENAESITNKNEPAKQYDSAKESTEKLQIADLINKELAKFVENADLNRKVPEYIEDEHSNSQTTLDVENVYYECVSKTELSFEEAGLSDKSF